MAINNVSFGNDQQQKQSTGIIIPVIGAGAGVGVTALTKLGKKPALSSLEGVNADTFQKAVDKAGLEGDDKTKAADIKAYLEKEAAKPAETPKADAKPAENKTETAKTDKSADAPKAEVKPAGEDEAKFIEQKTQAFEALGNEHTRNANIYTAEQNAAAKIQKAYNDVVAFTPESNAKLAPGETESALKARKTDLTTAIKNNETLLKEDKKLDKAGKEAITARVEAYKKEVNEINSKIFTIDEHMAEKFESLKKAYTPDSNVKPEETPVAKASAKVKEAETAHTNKVEAETKAEKALSEAKEASKPAEEITKLEQELATAKKETISAEKVKLDAANDLKVKTIEVDCNKAIADALGSKDPKAELAKLHDTKLAKIAPEGVVFKDLAQSEGKARIAFKEMKDAQKNAGLQVAEDAEFKNAMGEKYVEVEKLVAKGGSDASKDISKEASKIPANIQELFDAIKGKFKPEMRMGRIAAGAGIGLVAGMIVKMMVDGGSKSES